VVAECWDGAVEDGKSDVDGSAWRGVAFTWGGWRTR